MNKWLGNFTNISGPLEKQLYIYIKKTKLHNMY